MTRLENRVALVTGAGSGIGRASSLAFAVEGAAVMCADIDEAAAQDTAAQIAESGGTSAALKLDVTDDEAVGASLAATIDELGGLDVLFNNAGIGGGEAGWEQVLAVNLSGVYYGLKHAAPLLAERGGGVIINTSSIAGLVGLVGAAAAAGEMPDEPPGGAYVASKHGVVGLTRQFAVSYGRRGVRVNCINPGYVETPMTAGLRENEQGREFLSSLHPMGRLGQPEEIAGAAVFLASDDASFINGHTLVVDGGYTAR
ncbi:MAG: SDR family NAD(P)-dependent oxidoreductase [Dehalococcoidia bacterium]|jgi:NAD(P)-dependent dehydrogenase (short-subunit alcohol dehydrogenase family)|nr:SDR family NAD(P)-dependent oxidoreductase [Dehalococcoidia bacterium]